MIKRKYSLNKAKDVDKVFKEGRSFYDDFFGLKVLENQLEINRFCIIISAKISKKSVNRNKIRRQIKAIISDLGSQLKEGFDVLIIIKKEVLDLNFSELKISLSNSFKKVFLLNNLDN